MKDEHIPLGFEIPSGDPVFIPLRHMAVTGQTQESGKTTTLEALIKRSKLRAVAFITKRGEGGFTTGRQIAPFFQERADWEFVESILESTMKQRMKFERSWVVRACKGASTLADVQSNVRELMAKSKRSMDQDMYMLLNEYLNKVVPLVLSLPKEPRLDLQPGLNVMNLLDYPEELQMLVVGSALRFIHAHEQSIVTIVPEAWKFIPQGRKTPVRSEVEKLVREGGGLKNYVWIDSQDMAGVEKLVLRAAAVWVIGVQREMNELKRALGNIPAGIRRPKAEDVAQLGVGEFFACWHKQIHKVYVRPVWLDALAAKDIAMGKSSATDLKPPTPKFLEREEAMISKIRIEELEKENKRLRGQIRQLHEELNTALNERDRPPAAEETSATRDDEPQPGGPIEFHAVASEQEKDAIYQYVRERIKRDSALLKLITTKPEIQVEVIRETITLDGKTLRGKLAEMIARGYFDHVASGNSAFNELKRRGFPTAKPNVYRELDKLATMGFLTKENLGYQSVADMKVRIIDKG